MQIMSHHECKPVRSEGLQNSKNLNIAKSRDFLTPPQGIPRSPFNRLEIRGSEAFHNPGETAQYGDNINKAGKSSRNLNRRYIFRI
jgi:hypothetical protein